MLFIQIVNFNTYSPSCNLGRMIEITCSVDDDDECLFGAEVVYGKKTIATCITK